MTHDEIKKALKNNGLNFSALAGASGRTYQSLTQISERKSKSQPAAKIIAAGVGKPISEVFPDIPEYLEPDKEQGKAARVERAKEALRKANLDVAVA